MQSQHIQTKHLLQQADSNVYANVIALVKLKPIEKQICNMIYLEGKMYIQIADETGYSEGSIKKIHSKIIKKVRNNSNILKQLVNF